MLNYLGKYSDMERNYDEIIAELLIQLDRHTAELMAARKDQGEINRKIFESLDDQSRNSSQIASQIVQSSKILDRIIKRNDLKVG